MMVVAIGQVSSPPSEPSTVVSGNNVRDTKRVFQNSKIQKKIRIEKLYSLSFSTYQRSVHPQKYFPKAS